MKGGNTRSILEPMLRRMADRVTGMNLRKGTLHYYLREKWVGEGEARGEARGLAQGEVIGELRMVKRAIARRFGMPDPDLGQRLETLNTEQLEALNESLFDMTSREDLLAWLDREQA